jgi:hypothetical protein
MDSAPVVANHMGCVASPSRSRLSQGFHQLSFVDFYSNNESPQVHVQEKRLDQMWDVPYVVDIRSLLPLLHQLTSGAKSVCSDTMHLQDQFDRRRKLIDIRHHLMTA